MTKLQGQPQHTAEHWDDEIMSGLRIRYWHRMSSAGAVAHRLQTARRDQTACVASRARRVGRVNHEVPDFDLLRGPQISRHFRMMVVVERGNRQSGGFARDLHRPGAHAFCGRGGKSPALPRRRPVPRDDENTTTFTHPRRKARPGLQSRRRHRSTTKHTPANGTMLAHTSGSSWVLLFLCCCRTRNASSSGTQNLDKILITEIEIRLGGVEKVHASDRAPGYLPWMPDRSSPVQTKQD
jgi:hypothetical protein